jgi:hypothetical protein
VEAENRWTNQDVHVDIGVEGGRVDGFEWRDGGGGRGGPRRGRGNRAGGRGVGVVKTGQEIARAPSLLVHCRRRRAGGGRHFEPRFGRSLDAGEIGGCRSGSEWGKTRGSFGKFTRVEFYGPSPVVLKIRGPARRSILEHHQNYLFWHGRWKLALEQTL